MAGNVYRKVQFFRLGMQVLDVESNTLRPVQVQEGIAREIFSSINGLPFTLGDYNSRYLPYDGNDLAMFVDEIGPTIDGRMAIVRRALLPDVEQQGVLAPLTIPTEAGLAEVTHFVYYPQQKVIGIEFNFFGPRPSRIADYLQKKSNGLANLINLTPILRLDVEEQLERIGEVALIQLEAHNNAISIIKDLDDNLGSAFEAAGRASEAETIEIILRKKRYSKEGFSFPLNFDRLLGVLRRNETRELFKKLKVRAENLQSEQVENFDLLADKMIISMQVARTGPRSRAIDTTSMYKAIKQAYHELEEQITISK